MLFDRSKSPNRPVPRRLILSKGAAEISFAYAPGTGLSRQSSWLWAWSLTIAKGSRHHDLTPRLISRELDKESAQQRRGGIEILGHRRASSRWILTENSGYDRSMLRVRVRQVLIQQLIDLRPALGRRADQAWRSRRLGQRQTLRIQVLYSFLATT